MVVEVVVVVVVVVVELSIWSSNSASLNSSSSSSSSSSGGVHYESNGMSTPRFKSMQKKSAVCFPCQLEPVQSVV